MYAILASFAIHTGSFNSFPRDNLWLVSAMTLTFQDVIGLLTLLAACPPTVWLLYSLYNNRHLARNSSMLQPFC